MFWYKPDTWCFTSHSLGLVFRGHTLSPAMHFTAATELLGDLDAVVFH